MTYNYRGARFNNREGSVPDWRRTQPADWRDVFDDPRAATADSACGWLIDRGYFETVGLAPDGDLLLRLTDKAWDSDRIVENDYELQRVNRPQNPRLSDRDPNQRPNDREFVQRPNDRDLPQRPIDRDVRPNDRELPQRPVDRDVSQRPNDRRSRLPDRGPRPQRFAPELPPLETPRVDPPLEPRSEPVMEAPSERLLEVRIEPAVAAIEAPAATIEAPAAPLIMPIEPSPNAAAAPLEVEAAPKPRARTRRRATPVAEVAPEAPEGD